MRCSAPSRRPTVARSAPTPSSPTAAGGRQVLWLPTFDDAERALHAVLREGDLCLVLGAGDVDALGRRLVT